MPLPAAALLVEFSAPGPHPPADASAILADAEAPETAEAAFARGREEGFAAAAAEYAAKLEEERAAYEHRLTEARALWAVEEGGRLAAQLDGALAALRAEIEAAAGEILSPFVAEALRMRSVGALAETLSPLLAGGEHALFRVSGPADLLEALRLRLGAAAAQLAFEPNGDIDVRVAAGRTLIETQLATWLPRIEARSA